MVILTSGTTGTPKGARLGRPGGLDPLASFLRIVPLNAASVVLIPAPLFHAHGYGQLMVAAGIGLHGGAARPLRPRAHACADRAPSRRGDGGRAGDAQADHGPAARDAAPLRHDFAAGGGRQRLGARAGAGADRSWTRSGPCSTTSTARPRCRSRRSRRRATCWRRPEPSGKPRAAHPRCAARRRRTAGAGGRDRPHLRRERHDVRRLHRRLVVTRDARGPDDRRRPRPYGRGGPPVRRCARGRHDRLGWRERLPGRGGGGAARLQGSQRGGRRRRGGRAIRSAAGRLRRSCAWTRELSTEELDAYARENLARFKVPREFRLLDELPRNATGKVLRRKLIEAATR